MLAAVCVQIIPVDEVIGPRVLVLQLLQVLHTGQLDETVVVDIHAEDLALPGCPGAALLQGNIGKCAVPQGKDIRDQAALWLPAGGKDTAQVLLHIAAQQTDDPIRLQRLG